MAKQKAKQPEVNTQTEVTEMEQQAPVKPAHYPAETDEEEQPPLQPTSVEKVTNAPVQEVITLPRGHVLLAELDSKGNEVNVFTVHERGWKQHYSDESKFRLKKKAQ